ncbi:hypothetical protein NCCP133_22340 [Cytobacillus sp. NCCP-133]|nr:hypothetical protein NCCP133_22340 [Cytobacillus sp. NCCP-133]
MVNFCEADLIKYSCLQDNTQYTYASLLFLKECVTGKTAFPIKYRVELKNRPVYFHEREFDGETENKDREAGEGYIDEAGFNRIIDEDTESGRNLFFAAVANGRIAGFSRSEGSTLKRSATK